MDEVMVPETDLPAISDDTLIALARRAEERIEAIKRIKKAVIAVTNENDWTDENGQPYLTAPGAEKVGRLFGISWRFDPPEIERLEDGHINVVVKGYFSLDSGATIEAIGTRSSKDPFFSKVGGNFRKPEEIDKNDVLKAAITNCENNGIKRLLGIRNLTWEEVRGAGIEQEKVARVERKLSPEKIKELRKRIEGMCLEMAEQDPEGASNILESLSSWEKDGKVYKGKRDVKYLSAAQVPVVYRKVKQVYEEWADSYNEEVSDVED